MPERAEGPQTPFEVYCYRCRVTFPLGTRRCVHCGGRVGKRPEASFGPAVSGARRSAGAPAEAPPEEEEEEFGPVALRRFGGLFLWALLLLGALISNLCGR